MEWDSKGKKEGKGWEEEEEEEGGAEEEEAMEGAEDDITMGTWWCLGLLPKTWYFFVTISES